MKKTKSLLLPALVSAALLTCLISCVNNLQEDTEENVTEGNIPIKLSTNVQPIKSRVTETAFEKDDAIGLYVIVSPSTLKQKRYVDNMKFTLTSSLSFKPQKEIYFPDGENTCDFMAYYPYSTEGIATQTSQLKVITHTDQSSSKSYSESGFMVATAKELAAKEEAVELLFANKLSRVNISLNPVNEYTPEELLAANPTVRLKNVHTEGTYDFATDKITNPGVAADIIPNGTWEITDNILTGKSCILIPQTFQEQHIIMEVIIDGTLFESTVTQELTLESGYSNELTLSLQPSFDGIGIEVECSINGWKEGKQIQIGAERAPTINVSGLPFNTSSVYKVFHRNTLVAEICKEYLCNEQIKAQAIVAYPISEEKTDWENGIVCEIIGETASLHGGKISWNKTSNTFNYLSGNTTPVNYLYVSEEGELLTNRPAKALQLKAEPNLLIDIRGEETYTYPIVKIGTQYWMQSNLKATKYREGTAITKGQDFTTVAPKYCCPNDYYYFYNSAAISYKELAPEGWRITNTTDWNLLKTYIANNASVLKSGTSWKEPEMANNLSGFNSVCIGSYQGTYSYKTDAYYWCTDNTTMYPVALKANNNTLIEEDHKTTLGAAIRCVKE